MKFAFLGSCGGMYNTGPGSLAYELTKGVVAKTSPIGAAVIGYHGMDTDDCGGASCWEYSVPWQHVFFTHMSQGKSISYAHEQANIAYPMCADNNYQCMRWVGDPEFRLTDGASPIVTREPLCGDTIYHDTIITRDMECGDIGLIIGRDGIILDCTGHSITGSGSGMGILLDGRTNVTIRNCTIQGFDYGIYSEGTATKLVIDNNTITSNTVDGIYVNHCITSSITNSTLDGNGRYGIYALHIANKSTIAGNVVSDNGADGISVAKTSSYRNYVSNNTVERNGATGITVLGSPSPTTAAYCDITHNTVGQNAQTGIYASRLYRNSFGYNTIHANGTKGMYLYICHLADVSSNSISNNQEDGIYFDYCAYVAAQNNIITNNTYGIYGDEASFLVLTDSQITGNSVAGLWFYDLSHNARVKVSNNLIADNALGIGFDNGHNNSVYANTFTGNTISAYEKANSQGNTWSLDGIGNAWSDFCSNEGYPNVYVIAGPGAGIDEFPAGRLAFVPPDYDQDGDVDQSDFGAFQACLGDTVSGCEWADFNADGYVNYSDYGQFAMCMSGSEVPVTRACRYVFVDCVPPQVSAPAVTGALTQGLPGTVTVSCTATDSNGTVQLVTANLSAIGGPAAQVLTHENHSFWSWSGTVTPLNTGNQTVTFTAIDNQEATGTAQVSAWVEALVGSMALISAGEFQMGDQSVPYDGSTDERPVHTVYTDAFYMDRTEVTNQQYADALNWAWSQGGQITVTNNIVYKVGSGTSFPYCDTTASNSSSRITWNSTTQQFGVVAGKEQHPMVRVSWYGAVAYCNWRSEMQGRPLCYDLSTWACNYAAGGYRLPTEAEWEKAARGGASGRRFPWSDQDTIQHARANYYSSTSYAYDTSPTSGYHPLWGVGAYPWTSPVGFFDGSLRYKVDFNWPGSATSYQTANGANDYSLQDMEGNVREWCNDWYSNSYYSISPTNNPRGPATGSYRVLRGGSWYDTADYCRAAYRTSYYPDYRDYPCGFRVACSVGGVD